MAFSSEQDGAVSQKSLGDMSLLQMSSHSPLARTPLSSLVVDTALSFNFAAEHVQVNSQSLESLISTVCVLKENLSPLLHQYS